MQKIKFAVLGLLAVSIAALAQNSAISFKLTALDSSIKSGTKIAIQFTTTNSSNHPVTYHNLSTYCDYTLNVLTASGSPATETEFKKQLHCVASGLVIANRDILVTLEPGESNTERIVLTELYDMSQPGEYSVQAERTFPGIGHFSSNVVTVTVTP
jgi:hypothetical protein